MGFSANCLHLHSIYRGSPRRQPSGTSTSCTQPVTAEWMNTGTNATLPGELCFETLYNDTVSGVSSYFTALTTSQKLSAILPVCQLLICSRHHQYLCGASSKHVNKNICYASQWSTWSDSLPTKHMVRCSLRRKATTSQTEAKPVQIHFSKPLCVIVATVL